MTKFYISDLHFDHESVINFDNRPYSSVEEMNNDLIKKWNDKVGYKDDVYICGDFCWTNKNFNYIINSLNGNKFLIVGNHDRINDNYHNKFKDITHYKEIKDGENRIVLSHYFIPFFNRNAYLNRYLLYGHSHKSLESQKENTVKEIFGIKNAYNICACNINYEPCTLEEIIKIYKER